MATGTTVYLVTDAGIDPLPYLNGDADPQDWTEVRVLPTVRDARDYNADRLDGDGCRWRLTAVAETRAEGLACLFALFRPHVTLVYRSPGSWALNADNRNAAEVEQRRREAAEQAG
jgi:hypothetical protein